MNRSNRHQWLKRTAYTLSLSILLFIIALGFLLFTTPGLKISKIIANRVLASKGIILSGKITGNIENLSLDALSVKNDTVDIELRHIHLDFSLWTLIFKRKLQLDSLAADTLNLDVKTREKPSETKDGNRLSDNSAFQMPIDLFAENIQLNNITYSMNKTPITKLSDLKLKSLNLTGEQLMLQQANMKLINLAALTLKQGIITLNPPFHNQMQLSFTSGPDKAKKVSGNLKIYGDFARVFHIDGQGMLVYQKHRFAYTLKNAFDVDQGRLHAKLTFRDYLTLSGAFLFNREIDWTLSAKSLNPAFNARLHLGGSIKTDNGNTTLLSRFCDADVAGNPIQCHIDLKSTPKQIALNHFSLQNTRNNDNITLHFIQQGDRMLASWQLVAKALGDYDTKLHGKLTTNGQIGIDKNRVYRLNAALNLSDFAYRQLNLEKLAFHTQKNQLTFNLKSPDIEMRLLAEIKALAFDSISILFKQIDIREQHFKQSWQLKHPSLVSVKQGKYLNIAPFCLYNGQNSAFCMSGNLSPNKTLLNSQGTIIPGTFLPKSPISGRDFSFDYDFNYAQMANQPPEGKLLIRGHEPFIAFPRRLKSLLKLKNPLGKAFDLSKIIAVARLKNERINAHLSSTLANNNIQFHGLVHPFNPFDLSQATLQGHLQLSAQKFNWVASLFPEFPMQINGGQLSSEIRIKGKLLSPETSGRIDFTNGSFKLFVPNTTLDDVNARITLSPPLNGAIKLQATIDNAPLSASGNASYGDQGFSADITLKGKKLLLLNTPEIKLTASPDISYRQKKEAMLSGLLNIDRLKVNLAELKSTNLQNTIQNDIVYVNGENTPIDSQKTTPFNLNLKVNFGDNAHLSGLGLNSKIIGELTVISKPNKPVLGIGTLTPVEGIFSAYGKKFLISRDSRILFNNTAIANPLLAIKAEYAIPTSVKLTQADAPDEIGIEISGTANNPTINLYSEPMLSQSDILSFILFGRALDQTSQSTQSSSTVSQAALLLALNEGGSGVINELKDKLALAEFSLGSFNDETSSTTTNNSTNAGQNNTAVFIGKQLTKRLYLSYGVGVFTGEQQGIATFALTPKWKLKGDVTTLDTGGDILYQTHSKH